jgi:hypothetical protein
MEDDIRLSSRTLEAALKVAKAERRFPSDLVEAVVVEFLARRGHLNVDPKQPKQGCADENWPDIPPKLEESGTL